MVVAGVEEAAIDLEEARAAFTSFVPDHKYVMISSGPQLTESLYFMTKLIVDK